MSKVTQLRPVVETCPFQIGSRVSLRGGGVVMTITDLFEPIQPTNRWFAECCWHDDVGTQCCEIYPVVALYEPPEEVEGRAVAFKVVL